MAIYLRHPNGISDKHVSLLAKIPRSTLSDIRHRLPGMQEVQPGLWTITPTPLLIELAEAVMRRRDNGG